MDAAYNLARWLTRNDQDARDVVQDSMLRAYRYFDGLRGETRPWLLALVRNTCMTWLKTNRPAELAGYDPAAPVWRSWGTAGNTSSSRCCRTWTRRTTSPAG